MSVAAHYLLESLGPKKRRLICVVPSLFLAQRLGESHAGVALKFIETLPGYWEAVGPSQTYCIRLYPVKVQKAELGAVPDFFEAKKIDTTSKREVSLSDTIN